MEENTKKRVRARASKKHWILIAIVIVVAAVGVTWLGSSQPPIDVYSRPTPPISTDPASLLPVSVAGMTRIDMEANEEENYVDAWCDYEGGIHVEATRFESVGEAIWYIDNLYEIQVDYASQQQWWKYLRINLGGKHWWVIDANIGSYFSWRKGVWVFEVYAPTKEIRDDVVQGLNF
jgi:hypothetical protein